MHHHLSRIGDEWDRIYSSEGLGPRIIGWGRRFYDIFFCHAIGKYVSRDSTMIEMGCGTSSVGFLMRTRVRRYHGLDISPVTVKSCVTRAERAGCENMNFSVGDCRSVPAPFADNFDFAWSQGLIEHYDDPSAVVDGHVVAVRPGGVALMSVPYEYSYLRVWYAITRHPALRKFWPWPEQVFFSHKTLADIGRRTGMPHRVFLLRPFPIGFLLGIILLEVRKP